MARVLVPLAEGFEEIEAVTVVDLLRRAGIEVRTARAGAAAGSGRLVVGSHGIGIEADARLDEIDASEFDMIALPGGLPGATHLKADTRLIEMLRATCARGGYVAAICAAPGVLSHAGLLEGRAATSFPGVLDERSAPGLTLRSTPVVIDGRIVTSRGPGTAIDFALALIELLAGARARDEVESRLQRPTPAAQPA